MLKLVTIRSLRKEMCVLQRKINEIVVKEPTMDLLQTFDKLNTKFKATQFLYRSMILKSV